MPYNYLLMIHSLENEIYYQSKNVPINNEVVSVRCSTDSRDMPGFKNDILPIHTSIFRAERPNDTLPIYLLMNSLFSFEKCYTGNKTYI